jgi:hypothetical protein
VLGVRRGGRPLAAAAMPRGLWMMTSMRAIIVRRPLLGRMFDNAELGLYEGTESAP